VGLGDVSWFDLTFCRILTGCSLTLRGAHLKEGKAICWAGKGCASSGILVKASGNREHRL